LGQPGGSARKRPRVARHLCRCRRPRRDRLQWKHVIDLGDISTARGPESYLPLWIRLWGALQTADFNIKVVR